MQGRVFHKAGIRAAALLAGAFPGFFLTSSAVAAENLLLAGYLADSGVPTAQVAAGTSGCAALSGPPGVHSVVPAGSSLPPIITGPYRGAISPLTKRGLLRRTGSVSPQ